MLLLQRLFLVTLALTPSLVSAALFPKNTQVKMVDGKGLKKALKENGTSVVAFVAPWCGHCKQMGPEYSKGALGLYPLVPFYAVDCDKHKNVCSEHGVQGFPTVKLWPRGGKSKPLTFDGPERTASAFFYWASRAIPHGVKKLYRLENVPGWLEENKDHTRMLLLNNGKQIPLLWQVLGNKYQDHFKFSIHRDRKGKSSVKMGLEAGEKGSSKVLVYPAGEMDFVRFEGLTKMDSLTKFFDSIIDGTADLRQVNAEAAKEEFQPSEEELEIERQQEAQRIALAHGGFSDLIDFEEAIKQYGPDFHGKHGFPGSMGNMPQKKAAEGDNDETVGGKEEDPIRRILKHQQEEAEKSASAPKMVKTGEGGQVVLDVPKTSHAKTPVATPTPSPASEAVEPTEEPSASPAPLADELEVEVDNTVSAEPGSAPAESVVAESIPPTEEVVSEGHVKDEL